MIKATILKNPPIGYENIFAGNYEENQIPEDKIAVSEAIDFSTFIKAKWNGFEFIEGASQTEINNSNKKLVPETVTAIQFISQLSFEGITEDLIMTIIDTLPEPNKTVAKVSYKRAIYFERNNHFISMIGQVFEKTEEQLDQIFINASKI